MAQLIFTQFHVRIAFRRGMYFSNAKAIGIRDKTRSLDNFFLFPVDSNHCHGVAEVSVTRMCRNCRGRCMPIDYASSISLGREKRGSNDAHDNLGCELATKIYRIVFGRCFGMKCLLCVPRTRRRSRWNRRIEESSSWVSVSNRYTVIDRNDSRVISVDYRLFDS